MFNNSTPFGLECDDEESGKMPNVGEIDTGVRSKHCPLVTTSFVLTVVWRIGDTPPWETSTQIQTIKLSLTKTMKK